MIKCNRKFAFPDKLVPPPPWAACRNQFEKLRTANCLTHSWELATQFYDTTDLFYLLEDKKIRRVWDPWDIVRLLKQVTLWRGNKVEEDLGLKVSIVVEYCVPLLITVHVCIYLPITSSHFSRGYNSFYIERTLLWGLHSTFQLSLIDRNDCHLLEPES